MARKKKVKTLFLSPSLSRRTSKQHPISSYKTGPKTRTVRDGADRLRADYAQTGLSHFEVHRNLPSFLVR